MYLFLGKDMIDVEEWQLRLKENFSFNGIIGFPLLSIIEKEKQYGIFVEKTFFGYNVLMNSFQSFFVETFECFCREK